MLVDHPVPPDLPPTEGGIAPFSSLAHMGTFPRRLSAIGKLEDSADTRTGHPAEPTARSPGNNLEGTWETHWERGLGTLP